MPVMTIKTVEQLTDERAKLMADASAIIERADAEKRALTDEENDAANGFLAESEAVGAEIAERRTAQTSGRLAELRAQQLQPNPRRTAPMAPRATPSTAGEVLDEARRRRFEGFRMFQGIDAREKATGFMKCVYAAIGTPQQQRSALDWMDRRVANKAELRVGGGMTEGVEADGGFTVPTEYSQDVILNIQDVGAVGQLMRIFPMTRDSLWVPKVTTLPTVYAVNEGVDITVTKAQGAWVKLDSKKWASIIPVSSELDDDSLPYIGDVLAEVLSLAHAAKRDDVLLFGDGTAGYNSQTGVFPGTLAGGTITLASSDVTKITLAMLWPMLLKVKSTALGDGCAWVMNRALYDGVVQPAMASVGGTLPNWIQNPSQPPSLFSYPVAFTQAGLIGTSISTPIIAFGNFKRGGAFGDRRKVTLAKSEHVWFNADQVAMRCVERYALLLHDLATAGAAGMFAKLVTGAVP